MGTASNLYTDDARPREDKQVYEHKRLDRDLGLHAVGVEQVENVRGGHHALLGQSQDEERQRKRRNKVAVASHVHVAPQQKDKGHVEEEAEILPGG